MTFRPVCAVVHSGFQPGDHVEEFRTSIRRIRRGLEQNPKFVVTRGKFKAIRHHTRNVACLSIYRKIVSKDARIA